MKYRKKPAMPENITCAICDKEINWLISIANVHLCGKCSFKYGGRLEDAISEPLQNEIHKIKEKRRLKNEN